jgi:hypothetical protein
MKDNSMLIDFRFSKSKLNQYLQQALAYYENQKLSSEDFAITILKSSNNLINISAKQKSVFADVPVSFKFMKDAGLFSVEGEGSIRVQLEIICDIDVNFGLKTKTVLHGYQWEKGPVLHVGELNIPIETISNCVISFMKESLMEKLDTRLAETADIKKIINEQLQQYAHNYPVYKNPDLYFNGQLLQVQADEFREDENDIRLDLWVEISGKISDMPVKFEMSSDPLFYWIEQKPKSNSQSVEVEISYIGLAKMIMNEMNGQEIGGKEFQLESVHIRNTNLLEVKVNMIEPIKGIITICCQPILEREAQKINISDLEVDVDAANFIYKISSPIIANIIRNKVLAIMPFDPKPYLKNFLTKPPQIHLWDNKIELIPSFSQIFFDKIAFSNQSIICTVLLDDAELDVVL